MNIKKYTYISDGVTYTDVKVQKVDTGISFTLYYFREKSYGLVHD